MGAFKPAWPLGLGINDELLAAALNLLDRDHVKAPNFVDGGAVYSPLAQIVYGGGGFKFNCPVEGTWATPTMIVVSGPSGIQFSAPTRFAVSSDPHLMNGAIFTIDAGGALVIAKGANLNVSGNVDIAANASISVEGKVLLGGGGQILGAPGSVLQMAPGSICELDGQTTLTGPILKSGNAAAETERFLTLPDGTPQTIDTRSDVFEVPPVLTHNTVFNLAPGTHVGQHFTVFRFVNLSPHSATLVDPSLGASVPSVTLAGGVAFFVDLSWTGTGWKPVRWSATFQTAFGF